MYLLTPRQAFVVGTIFPDYIPSQSNRNRDRQCGSQISCVPPRFWIRLPWALLPGHGRQGDAVLFRGMDSIVWCQRQREQGTEGKAPRSVGRANTSHLTSTPDMQPSFFQLDDPVLSQIRDEILGLDINNHTPVEALNKLNDIKKILRGRLHERENLLM